MNEHCSSIEYLTLILLTAMHFTAFLRLFLIKNSSTGKNPLKCHFRNDTHTHILLLQININIHFVLNSSSFFRSELDKHVSSGQMKNFNKKREKLLLGVCNGYVCKETHYTVTDDTISYLGFSECEIIHLFVDEGQRLITQTYKPGLVVQYHFGAIRKVYSQIQSTE